MKYFDALFSLIAAVLVSALLPYIPTVRSCAATSLEETRWQIFNYVLN